MINWTQTETFMADNQGLAKRTARTESRKHNVASTKKIVKKIAY